MTDQQDDIRIGPWATAASQVSKVLFRVEAGDNGGSAFAVTLGSAGGSPPFGLLLATAFHVLDGVSQDDDDIAIFSADGSVELNNSDSDVFLFRLGPAKYDTGLIMVKTSDPVLGEDELLPILQHEFVPAQGGELAWMGFPSIAWPNPCLFKGVVSGKMPDSEAYLIDGVAINGVSGGPAFNREGTIFGLVSAYIPNRVDALTTLPGLMLMVPTMFIDYWVENVLGAKGFAAG